MSTTISDPIRKAIAKAVFEYLVSDEFGDELFEQFEAIVDVDVRRGHGVESTVCIKLDNLVLPDKNNIEKWYRIKVVSSK